MNPNARTYNPWGHVSRGERVARLNAAKRITLRMKLAQEPEWKELETLIEDIHYKRAADPDAAKKRINELCDTLNGHGFSDADIEAAL